jgi:hypothetical protein
MTKSDPGGYTCAVKAADYEATARRRHQCPTPKNHGNYWTILVRLDELDNEEIIRRLKRVALCRAIEFQNVALRLRDGYVRTLNNDLCAVGSATGFREFVNGTYLRYESATLAKATLERYKGVLKNYLLPAFGDKMLRELTPPLLPYFSGFANSKLSYESIDKVRDVLAAILVTRPASMNCYPRIR